ncbi:ABC-2 type transport system permease protein [Arthrobacter sp. GAS37]|uniref:ABC transporter permease n=1 Tax=Arthrobacter sp. GAS37 TaxID=3156261 RepID=UPI003838E2BF
MISPVQVRSGLSLLAAGATIQIAESRSGGAMLVTGMVQPITLLLVLMSQRGVDPTHSTNLVLGVVLTSFWSSTVWGASGILRRDRRQGTLIRTLLGTRDPLLMLVGRTLGASVFSIATVTVATCGTLILMHVTITVNDWVGVVVGFFLTVIGGIGMGLLLCPLFVVSRYALHISSALMYPIIIFGGLLVPIDALPNFLRWIPLLINLHWIKQFLASSVSSSNGTDWASAGIAMALTVGCGLLGALVFRTKLVGATQRGDLDLA